MYERERESEFVGKKDGGGFFSSSQMSLNNQSEGGAGDNFLDAFFLL